MQPVGAGAASFRKRPPLDPGHVPLDADENSAVRGAAIFAALESLTLFHLAPDGLLAEACNGRR